MSLSEALQRPDEKERLAAVAAWLQALFPEGTQVPVLVGGAAVELYTGGAYRTGDLDFVGRLVPPVVRALEQEGFRKEGRHWIHDEHELFLEFPGAHLDEGDLSARLRVGEVEVVVLGLEELIVDRLAAWQFWGSEIDARNAWLLWRAQSRKIDPVRLRELARRREVTAACRSLSRFVSGDGGQDADDEAVARWTRERP